MSTFTLTLSSHSSADWGDIALVFTGAAGTGASASTTGSGAPSLTLTTTQAGSDIAVVVLDHAGADGTSRTWLTVNGATPTAGNGEEVAYSRVASTFTAYAAYYPNAGGAGVKTVGLSAPGGMTYTIIAVEILNTTVPATGAMTRAPLAMAGTGKVTGAGSLTRAPLAIAATGVAGLPPSFPAAILGITVELLINSTWVDISSYVYARNDIEITRGRPDETQQVQPAQCKLVLNNRDGRFSPSNLDGAYAPYFGRNVQLRVSATASTQTAVTEDIYTSTYTSAYGTPGTQVTQYSGYRFWGEIASLEQHSDPSSTDIFVNVTASGPLRRYSQGNASIGSALRRYYSQLPAAQAPYGYWPCEDDSAATEIASAVEGVPAMGFTGSPGFGSDSTFGGSDPIPSINSSIWHGQTLAAANPSGSGSLTENTAGTYSFTAPPGVTQVTGVVATGAGGGGGSWGNFKGGGGGGGGGTGASSSVAVTPGKTYQYTVGAGGAGGGSPGTPGSAGQDSLFTGDTVTVRGGGGGGGVSGDVSAGGAAGAAGSGGHAGGAGGTGQQSTTVPQNLAFNANSGPSGTAGGGKAGVAAFGWTCPAGVSTVTVTAAAGGGGGQGGGNSNQGYGGGGGGGGGKSTGTISVSAGSVYTMTAGDGGAGGVGSGPSQAGMAGGDSGVSGDSGTSVKATGGAGGSGAGHPGGGGTGTIAGSAGGAGAKAITGAGMGGGGGGGGGGGDTGTGGGASGGGSPRSPGAGGGDGSGGGWGASSNGASDATGGGTAATMNLVAGGGGGGGGGAVTNTSGKGGGGGGGGWILWTWNQTGLPSGGGGGSSATSSSAGNAGSTNGTGGTAPAGGGSGGAQGLSGSIPGGGGGGGVPDTGNVGSGTVSPGAGAPGQVAFSWSGGTVSPVAADIVRFALSVQSTGGVWPSFSFTGTNASPCVFTASGSAYANGTPVQLTGASLPTGFIAGTTYYIVAASTDTFELAATLGGSAINSTSTGSGSVASVAGWRIASILTYGTVARMDVTYYTGGALDLTGYNSAGTLLFDSAHVGFGADGTPQMVDVQLVANGSGGASWHINTIRPGATVQNGLSGNISNVTVGYVSDVLIDPDGTVDFAAAGQVAVQTYADTLQAISQVIAGYAGETAAARLARLCAEEGLAFELNGTTASTPAMGAQQDDTLVNVFQSCEDMDRGQLYEPRDAFGIGYRTRVSMQGQDPAITLDYSAGQLAADLVPVADDQFTRNDIKITRNNGSSSAAILSAGPMSTASPPAGVGTYLYSLTVQAFADTQLANLAAWILTTGTVADDRYPVLPVNLARSEVSALMSAVAELDVGDFVQVASPPAWLTSTPIQQLAFGFTEKLNAYVWTVDVNAVPEAPYGTGNPPSW